MHAYTSADVRPLFAAIKALGSLVLPCGTFEPSYDFHAGSIGFENDARTFYMTPGYEGLDCPWCVVDHDGIADAHDNLAGLPWTGDVRVDAFTYRAALAGIISAYHALDVDDDDEHVVRLREHLSALTTDDVTLGALAVAKSRECFVGILVDGFAYLPEDAERFVDHEGIR